MKILTIRTDKPEAELGLYENEKQVVLYEWEAHRQLANTLHSSIERVLTKGNMTWSDIGAIVVYQGPGSFTGLRIGISVANALAFSLTIPIIGSSGDNWVQDGIRQLLSGKNDSIVTPEYGADVHITLPKK